MKRAVKAGLKAFWRWTRPLRRPLENWFDETVARCIRPTEVLLVEEAHTLMEHLVRELVRLQRQVEHLQHAVEDLSTSPGHSGIAGERASTEQLKAG